MLEEEKTALMTEAAFDEVEKIMKERGATQEEVDKEFLYYALYRFWDGEKCADLKAKITALTDKWAEDWCSSLGDEDSKAA